jgi:polar amino acid transport system substrate-binding protein
VSLALVLGACGDDGDDDEGAAGVTKLTACSDTPYPPFEFQDDDGKDVGYDIDILRAIAKDADVDFEVIDVPFEGILGNLAAGTCNVVASALSITPERKEQADFSDGYFLSDQSLLVRSEDAAAYTDLASLQGKTIGVQATTTGEAYANQHAQGATVKSYPDSDALFAALSSGEIAAILQDFPVNYDRAGKDDAFQLTATFDTNEPYGFAVKKGDAKTLEVINSGIAKLKADGTTDELFDKYFPESQ